MNGNHKNIQDLMLIFCENFSNFVCFLLEQLSLCSIIKMNPNTLILLTLFIAEAFSACRDPNEADGSCTACQPTDLLLNGVCQSKLQGCLVQQPRQICSQCQSGFVLFEQQCVRSAIFFGQNSSQVPPLTLEEDTLEFEEIVGEMIEANGVEFVLTHSYFLQSYPQLFFSDLDQVRTLPLKSGFIVVITYKLEQNKKYQAVGVVDKSNSVTEISFGLVEQPLTDPITANNLVKKVKSDILKNKFLFSFSKESEQYIYNYLDDKNQVTRVSLNKNDLKTPATAKQKIKIKNLRLLDLAKDQLLQKHPFLRDLGDPKTEEQLPNFLFIFYFGNKITVSVSFEGDQFVINDPVQNAQSPENQSTEDQLPELKDLTDPQYISALEHTLQEFPELIGEKVKKVIRKPGENPVFIIFFQNQSKEKYKIEVSKQQALNEYQIQSAFKDQKLIYALNYDYNRDILFLENYSPIAQSLTPQIPIVKVIWKVIKNKNHYFVFYQNQKYSQFELDQATNSLNVLSYPLIEDTSLTNIPITIIRVKPGNSQGKGQSPKNIVNLVNGDQVKINNANRDNNGNKNSQIKGINSILKGNSKNKSILTVIGFPELQQNQNCYQLTKEQIKLSRKIAVIDEHLKSQLSIHGFYIQLVQVQIQNPETSILRFLYADSEITQIQIFLRETGPTITFLFAKLKNDGYGALVPNYKNQRYLLLLQILEKVSSGASPIYSEFNGTHVRTFHQDEKSITYKLTISLATRQFIHQQLSTGGREGIPEGFNSERLIVPGVPSKKDNEIINSIVEQISKNLKNNANDLVIRFVQKNGDRYKILVHSPSQGYIQALALAQNKNKIEIRDIKLVNYFQSPFVQCKQEKEGGSCLTCQPEQLHYAGNCFQRLVGCLTQLGGICVKCISQMVLKDGVCLRDCSVLFP